MLFAAERAKVAPEPPFTVRPLHHPIDPEDQQAFYSGKKNGQKPPCALGGDYVVNRSRYLPRQDGKIDGGVTRYSFSLSEDEKNWGELAETGILSTDITGKEVVIPGQVRSFVRFVAHAEVNGGPRTNRVVLGRPTEVGVLTSSTQGDFKC
jgi:F5/8 type C domain